MRRGWSFSDSTFAACKWGVRVKKHMWPYWLITWPVEQRGLWRVGTGFPQAEEEALENKSGAQTQEQRNRNFSNLFKKGKLREAVHFIFKQYTGGGLLPNERAHYKSTVMDKTVVEVLEGKICTRNPNRCCVGSVRGNTRFYPCGYYGGCGRDSCVKISGSAGPSGTYSKALQGWVLKFGDHSINISVNVRYFVDWLAKKPPWAASQEFMSGCLIALNKIPRLCLVGVEEMWYRLFAKCALKVTGSDATHVWRDDQLCAILKEGIDGALNGVQYIWEDSSTEENWIFLNLLTQITRLMRSIKS